MQQNSWSASLQDVASASTASAGNPGVAVSSGGVDLGATLNCLSQLSAAANLINNPVSPSTPVILNVSLSYLFSTETLT